MQFSFFFFSLDCYGPQIKVHFNELYCSPVKFNLFVERHIFTNTTIFVYFVNVNVLVDKRVRKKTKIIT